jgi:hypothetical protein
MKILLPKKISNVYFTIKYSFPECIAIKEFSVKKVSYVTLLGIIPLYPTKLIFVEPNKNDLRHIVE